MRQKLRIALPKGGLLPKTVEVLCASGITNCGETDALMKSRSLIWDLGDELEGIICRPGDVPVYVKYGAADLGICGKDVLMEEGEPAVELLDLKYGFCRFVWAQPAQKKEANAQSYLHLGQLRIATKFPRVTENYFKERGIQIEVIKLKGAIEVAPLVGLADQIVDLASTGKTLKENGLEVIEVIAECSARMIANPAALRLREAELVRINEAIAGTISEANQA